MTGSPSECQNYGTYGAAYSGANEAHRYRGMNIFVDRALQIVWLAILSLLIAGCQLIPKPKLPLPVPVETPKVVPIKPGLPTDTSRHRVALLLPQSGLNADVGTAIANATTMALLDTGNEKIRITIYDTVPGARLAARRALADGNKLILGPLLFENVKVVAPLARASGVPVLSFSNDIGVAGNGVFLMGFVPGQSVDRVISYARSKGHRRFGALVPRSVYGERSLTAFRSAVSRYGGEVVAVERYDRRASSLSGAARRLVSGERIDAVLIADSGNNAMRVAPLLREYGDYQILGTELWNTDANLGGSPVMRGAWFASVSDRLYGKLATRYRGRYGRAPYRLASLGYDSVLLTVRIAREWQMGSIFPVSRLLSDEGFGGIDGIFRFDSRGIAVRSLDVSEVGAGGFRVISPALARW